MDIGITIIGVNTYGDVFDFTTSDIDEAIEYLIELRRKTDEDDWE